MPKEGFEKIVQMALDYLLNHPSIFINLFTFFIVGIILIFWKKDKQDYSELPDGNIVQHRDLPNPENYVNEPTNTNVTNENANVTNENVRNENEENTSTRQKPVEESEEYTYIEPIQARYQKVQPRQNEPDIIDSVHYSDQAGPSDASLIEPYARDFLPRNMQRNENNRITLAELKKNRTSEITVASNSSDPSEMGFQFERSNSITYVPMGPNSRNICTETEPIENDQFDASNTYENVPVRHNKSNITNIESGGRGEKCASGAYKNLADEDDFETFEELQGNILRLTMNFNGSRENSYLEPVTMKRNN